MVLPHDPISASTARRVVRSTVHDWGCEEAVEAAELVTSELVTNALLHAGTRTELQVRLADDRLRIEVADDESSLPVVKNPGGEELGGRGLVMVDALAESWGCDADATGKVVWCELPVAD